MLSHEVRIKMNEGTAANFLGPSGDAEYHDYDGLKFDVQG